MNTVLAILLAVQIPAGYWPESKSNEILAKTETIRLAPDLSVLTESERAALKDLLAGGEIMQQLYEESRHHQALAALAELQKLPRTKQTENLLTLYRLNHGPIAVTLGNQREAFLPVAPQVPGRNVYPVDVTREELDAFLEANPAMRDEILAGVYDVVADFGQARTAKTATILPNDPLFARRYGRTILLRENIMKHPGIFAQDLRVFRAVTVAAHHDEYASEGNFQRTLWHEIGHHLGPDGETLEEYTDSVEEMKSDLVSLFALHRMNHPALRAIQSSGIRRTLQSVKPREDQPYQRMQLIQFNWFVDKGLLTVGADGRLTIHHDKYLDTVTSLLREALRLQQTGDKAAAAAFYAKWTAWTPELHEKLPARIREAQGARFRLMTYGALGE